MLIRRRLERASKAPAHFLLDRVAADFEERLSLVSRDFSRALDLGTPGPQIAGLLRRDPARFVVRAAPLLESAGGLALVADEEALPFGPGCFDLIAAGLSLQWANDLPGALVQIRRA